MFTGSGTSWATSTVNTTLTGAVSAPGSATVNVASTTGITTSTVLRIFDNSSYGSVEDVVPSAVGAGSITAIFRYPHASGDIVASGGLSNSCIELTADTVLGSFGGDYVSVPLRRAFPIILSTGSTSATVWASNLDLAPYGQTTAWANASGQNGYAIYSCAEAVSWVGSGASAGQLSDTAALEPNAVSWANNDTVELSLYPFPYINMGAWGLEGFWPGTVGGAGIDFWGANSDFYGFTLINSAPGTQYADNGGYLKEPSGYRLNGPWGVGLYMDGGYPRQAIGLQFQNAPNGGVSPGYYLTPIWAWSSAGSGYDQQQYDQNTGAWYLSTGGHCSGCTYTFAPTGNGNAFNFPEHIGSLNNDAQGTISISSGTSASHAFSHSYTSAPICVLTPTSDPTSAGVWWVTTTTTQVTANIHTAAAITFTYVCHGNPN